MKTARDIEAGDRITRTRNGKPEAILTVAEVLSRRGGLRRVRVDGGSEVLLRVLADGRVRHERSDSWSSIDYRREEPGDGGAAEEARVRARLNDKVRTANVHAWPIEDALRVLAAWPGEKK